MHSLRSHWNNVYQSKPETSLSWYEGDPAPSLEMVQLCNVKKPDLVVDAGAGLSQFLEKMLEKGYSNLTAIDISESAIEKAKERIGADKALQINWFINDLAKPEKLALAEPVSLWHDRAVFHFLTQPEEQEAYIRNLEQTVALGGNVIMATHAPQAPNTCSNLPVICYDKRSLTQRMGDKFMLLYHFYHQHHTPAGQTRPFLYALYQKIME
ncbi:MAG: class I SAM-dependent methyltransferase [Hymenobacteraceae bacterium]|nr:class I SAM-dependent methyltransferase [Hymenobacteraceae bacterium]MDX5396249.1 class I SAM-dependent methyltransferase [Hymenobacteraceae bacterium]MDX5512312.1 class I SAM-dependent methyltransferase [Hymenobacteraceae bacterium]